MQSHAAKLYAAALVLSLIVMLSIFYYSGHTHADDTFIYMRYVKNAIGGYGFVYNAGESSLGATSSILPVIMKPVALLFGNTLRTWKAVSILLMGMQTFLFFIMVYESAKRFGLAVVLTLASKMNPWSFRWGSAGMDNSLILFVLTAGFWAYRRCLNGPGLLSKIILGISIALFPFIRPELSIFSLGIFLICTRSLEMREREIFWLASILTLTAFTFTVWSLFGKMIPQTAAARAIALRQNDYYYGFKQALLVVFSGSLGWLFLFLTVKVDRYSSKMLKVLVLTALIVYVSYFGWRNHLVSTRYATFLCDPLIIAAAMFISERASLSRGERQWFTSCLTTQLLLFVLILVFVFPSTRISEHKQISKFASYTRQKLGRDRRIALSEIGVFGFYAECYIIDLLGLTDTATLKWLQEHGRIDTMDKLEALLQERRATHYVDTFATETYLEGKSLRFIPIYESPIIRNNISGWRLKPDLWRLYRIERIND